MKRHLGILIALTLFLAGCVCLSPRMAYADTEEFIQTDWSGGVSVAPAQHPTAKTGWDEYSSKTANIDTSHAGEVRMTSEEFSLADDTDIDFTKGTRSNIEISGAGTAATLGLSTTYQDPFCSALGEWTTMPFSPYMGQVSPLVRAGNYLYSLWVGGGNNKGFFRWSFAQEKWEKLADMPMSVGLGAALGYDGGDIIYALIGGGSKYFYAYRISTNTWHLKKEIPSAVSAGGALVGVPAITKLFAFCGGGSSIFYRYTPPAQIEQLGSWSAVESASFGVNNGSSLVYPGSGNFIYAAAGGGSFSFAKFDYNASSNAWSSLANTPVAFNWTSDVVYPGTGSYLYAMKGDVRWFGRYHTGNDIWESSSYPASPVKNIELPSLPFTISSHMYLYDALGDGSELRLLSNHSYSSTYRYYTAANKWREESLVSRTNPGWGQDAVYVAAENAIYWIPGNGYKEFYKYHLDFYAAPSNASVQYQWERLLDVSFANNAAGVYVGGDLAYKPGDNYIYCLQGYNWNGFSRYNLTTKNWEQLAPLPQKSYWGGTLAVAGDYLYATGGQNADTGQYTNNLYRYDPSANTWVTISNCPYGSFYYGAAMVYPEGSDYIYMLRHNSRTEFIRYQISTGLWDRRANLPDMWMGYQGKLVYSSAEDALYFMNGHDGSLYNMGFCKYAIASNSWQSLDSQPFQNNRPAVCASATKLYYINDAIAGSQTYTFATGQWNNPIVNANYDPSSNYFGSVVTKGDYAYVFLNYRSNYAWKYSISQKKWIDLLMLPFSCQGYGHKAVYPGSGDYIYIAEGNLNKRFWRYNTETGAWEQRASCPNLFSYGTKMVADATGIYVCPGAYNSNAFLKFEDDETGGSWISLGNLLDSISSEGNGMCIISSGSYKGVYLLRQNGSNRFSKYNLDNSTWGYLADAPWTVDSYAYLIYPGSGNFIYCLKGQGRDFAKYDLAQNAWTILTEAPINASGGAGGFYPGSGDIIYFCLAAGHGTNIGINFNRYSISQNRWDEPIQFPAGNSTGSQICAMPSGEEIFYMSGGGSNAAYKYNIPNSVWYTLNTAPNGITWDGKAVYPGAGDSIYVSRGDGTYDFWRYSVNTDYWTTLAAPPYTFSSGSSIAYYKDMSENKEYVFVIRGGSTSTFMRYSVADNAWLEKATTPTTCTRGANLLYPGSGGYLYALAGGGSVAFWRYNVSTNAWGSLSPLPMANSGGILFSPGFGDYLYFFVSYTYDINYGTNYFYRYSITQDTWELLSDLPLALRGQCNAAYPGTGDYVYLQSGYGTNLLMKYLLFSSGIYESEIKEIGNNNDFGAITWTDSGLGQVDVKVRTGKKLDLSDAIDWSYASKVAKNSDLSDYASVKDKDTYLQYRLRFFCYDLAELPNLDRISLEYNKFSLAQELVSSAYNTTAGTNRLRGISWDSALSTGSDLRFQMRTAQDAGGSPGTWGPWLGPAGIQQIAYEFTDENEYAKTSEVVVVEGKAKLSKILADYLYRQRIIIDNSSGAQAYNNSTIKIDISETNIDFWQHVADDGSDIRFTDSDGRTPLGYRLLGFSKSKKSASAWVTVPYIPQGVTKDIYLLYGKSTATTESNSTLAESLLGTDFYAFMFAFLDIVTTEAPNRVYIDKLNVDGQVIASTYRDLTNVGEKVRYDDSDLTVYRVRADKPIAIFSSSVEPTSYWDDDWYSVCGNDLWLWLPSNNYDGDVIITAYNDDTTIKITDYNNGDDSTTIGLDKGNFWFGWNRVDSRGEVWHIEATKPVTVMAGLINHGEGIEQMRSPDMKEYYFYCPEAYVTVTAYEDNTNIIIDNLDSTTGDYSGMLNKGKSYKHIPVPPTSGLSMRAYVWADKPICVVTEDIGGNKAQIFQSSDTLLSVGKEYYFNTASARYLALVSFEDGGNNISIDDDVGTPTLYYSLGVKGSSVLVDAGPSTYRSLKITGTKKFGVYNYGGSWGEGITPVLKPTEFNYTMPTYLVALEDAATSANPALSGWLYKETIVVDNTANDTSLTDFQIYVDVDRNHKDFWDHCVSDGGDVRFVDSDDAGLLPYYTEYFSYSERKARFWIKLPTLSNTAEKTIYMYYGKVGGVTLSNGSQVFEFFDDFDGSLDQWNAKYCNLTTVSAIFGMDSVVFNLPTGTNQVNTNVVIPTAVIPTRDYDWYWELRWPTNEALVEAQPISQPFTLQHSLLSMTDGPFMVKAVYNPASLSLTGASWNANVATMNTQAAHGLVAGQRVTISGVTPSAYNGSNFIITSVVDSDTFTITLSLGSNPGAGSGGTAHPGQVIAGLGGTFTNNETYDYENVKYRFSFTDVDTGTTFSNIESSTFTIPQGQTTSVDTLTLFMPVLTSGRLYYWSWDLRDQNNDQLFSSDAAPAALFNIACGFEMTTAPTLPAEPYTGGSTRQISSTFSNSSATSLNNLFWRFTMIDTSQGGRSVAKVAHNGYIQAKVDISPNYNITSQVIWQVANKTGRHFLGIADPNAKNATDLGNSSYMAGYDVLIQTNGYYYNESGNGYNAWESIRTPYTATTWNTDKISWSPHDPMNGKTGKVIYELSSGDKLTYNAGFVVGPNLSIKPTVRSSKDSVFIDKFLVYKSANVKPYVGFVFTETANPTGMDVYYTTNPVIQPVLGVFYDNNLSDFTNELATPAGTNIKYQVSSDGYNWYWWEGDDWVKVTGGFSQANTAAEIKNHLSAYQTKFPAGEFWYRAYLSSSDGINTPEIDSVTVTTTTEPTYYVSPSGNAINILHHDTLEDQWFQYKAILSSVGQETPVLNEVAIDYVTSYIQVTSPNGEETINAGQTTQITWNAQAIDGASGKVRLEYSVDNGGSFIPIENNVDNLGTYDWAVPDAPSQNALVKIVSEDFPGVFDVSDGSFRILSLQVASPNGNEIWEAGKTHAVTWTTSGAVSDNLTIQYSLTNGSTWVNASTQRPNTGSYNWPAPSVSSDTVLVKIFDASNSNIMDISNAPFAIVPVPSITILSPAGGEIWKMGVQRVISWQTNQSQFSSTVNISYSTDEFFTDHPIVSGISIGTQQGGSTPNADILGSFDWTIPPTISDTVKVKVTEVAYPVGRDTAQNMSGISNTFSIIEPTITIISPTSSDVWISGDTRRISWSSEGTVSDDLRLEYSLDSGSTWTLIKDHESNGGNYDWLLGTETIGNSVLVKITDTTRPQVTTTSDPFRILGYPAIQITQPNGGEFLVMGENYELKWQSWGSKLQQGGSDYLAIKIYYSLDNGTSWTLETEQQMNDGSYAWEVPQLASENNECLIKILDGNDELITDVSDAVFSISNPSISITSPNGGESMYATGNYSIAWSWRGAVSDALTLEYSADNGAQWYVIAQDQENDGIYAWKAADENSSQVLVRITDTLRPVVTDVSNMPFTIIPPSLTVTSPDGGEEWVIGTEHELTWTSIGREFGAIRDRLTLQYSINNGTSWNTFALDELNDYSFLWTVPDAMSPNCLIKIIDASRPATNDTSNANFRIVLPYIQVLIPNGGESWPIGTSQEITWKSVGSISDNLTLAYSKDNFASATTIATGVARGTPNPDGTYSGSYTWPSVNDDYSAAVKVRVLDADRPAVYDVTDSYFVIAYPIIKVTRPDGGELFTVADQEAITWQNTGSVGNSLKLEYSKDNFVSVPTVIENSVENVAPYSYTWTVPADVSPSVRVRITDTARPVVWDKSDNSFTILPIPQITISAPDGGEVWHVGSDQPITWADNGGLVSNSLSLQFTTDGGTNWQAIANGVANTGQYTWHIPDQVSSTCFVKITDTLRSSDTDTSDEAFRIADPVITIITPNGGEVWAVDDRAPVTWSTIGGVSDSLVLEFSPDGGSTYYFVATVANSGSHPWTVPDYITSNAIFKIHDALRPITEDVSDAAFIINPLPTITISAPDGGEVLVLGETTDIQWDWTGLSISDNLVLEISNDNFVLSRQVFASGVPNTGRFSWTIPESTITGTTLKIRITDGNRTQITDRSDGFFRIRGGFTVTSPNGEEHWVAKSPQDVMWQTKGTISAVNLEYSIDGGGNWQTIASGTANTGVYRWTLPNVQSASAKVKVTDPNDNTVTDFSDDVFSIVYTTVRFNILDFDTLSHLSDFSVSEPSTSWTDSGVNSPITRTSMYPYGVYTTFFTKTGYIDNSATWTPPKQGTDVYVITVHLENAASAQVTWDAILTYSYSPADDAINAVGSLQRKGKLVGVTPEERARMGMATLIVYEPEGTTVRKTLSVSTPNTTGMYTFTYVNTDFEAGKVYPATLTIVYNEQPYTSSANIDVGAEKLQYEFFTQTASELAASVETIKSTVIESATQTAEVVEAVKTQLTSKLSDVESGVKSHVSSAVSASESTVVSKVSEAKDLTEVGIRSEILNTESTVKSGETLPIRYRTYSALSPVIDVYDGKNVQRVVKGRMKESGKTGIYEYALTFESKWGNGTFSIVCSEPAKGSLDALAINVINADLESISGQVAAILGSTTGLSDLKEITGNLDSQFNMIESAISKIGKTVVQEVAGGITSGSMFQTVFEQIVNASNQIKEMAGETTGVVLDKIYKISAERKDDIVYLKNKTQELKAAMELNQKLMENIANKPVTQTWYEYK